ncbi:hypothetical protein [Vibrio anguillarum]|uniref:Uncharacterized protein n=1 Tax=Vibrio anguillarum TaxID=55601 RepID=A0A7U6J6A3_VIBAN|nr:hypothetical protein [Vibrio anguillarum]AZS26287.1 hypothetical protein DYL72_15370 [Vibrio anguillarum]MBF4374568.1 hypothetical protein [Vibrio anguillarum]
MHYLNVVISSLDSMEKCSKAIQDIESDYKNVAGGITAFHSGYEARLLKGAEAKIKAIENRSDRLFIQQLKKQYKAFAKSNPTISWAEYYEQDLYI